MVSQINHVSIKVDRRKAIRPGHEYSRVRKCHCKFRVVLRDTFARKGRNCRSDSTCDEFVILLEQHVGLLMTFECGGQWPFGTLLSTKEKRRRAFTRVLCPYVRKPFLKFVPITFAHLGRLGLSQGPLPPIILMMQSNYTQAKSERDRALFHIPSRQLIFSFGDAEE